MIVLNIVLDPLAGWIWMGVIATATLAALIWRGRRLLRMVAIALIVLTALLREQSIPQQVTASIPGDQVTGVHADGYRAGAYGAVRYVRSTQSYALVCVGLLTLLALVGRRKKAD